MQQEVLLRDEETMELRETFTSLQQEVEIKTKKLKKVRILQKSRTQEDSIVSGKSYRMSIRIDWYLSLETG